MPDKIWKAITCCVIFTNAGECKKDNYPLVKMAQFSVLYDEKTTQKCQKNLNWFSDPRISTVVGALDEKMLSRNYDT